jgi:DNA-binding MarR family transcriptional regulator
MTPPETHELARAIVALLPRLTRQLSRTGQDDPLADLPVAQFRVIIVLIDGSRAMSELSQELGVSLSAITQTADRLARVGLVERMAEVGDRRVRRLCLTPHAETLMRARREARVTRVARALATLPAPERVSLHAALAAFHAACVATGGEGESSSST